MSIRNALHNKGNQKHIRLFLLFYFYVARHDLQCIRHSPIGNTRCTCQTVPGLQNLRKISWSTLRQWPQHDALIQNQWFEHVSRSQGAHLPDKRRDELFGKSGCIRYLRRVYYRTQCLPNANNERPQPPLVSSRLKSISSIILTRKGILPACVYQPHLAPGFFSTHESFRFPWKERQGITPISPQIRPIEVG